MFFNKILKTKNRFRAYPTPQAVQTTGSTATKQAKISKLLNKKTFLLYFRKTLSSLFLLFFIFFR